MTTKAKRARLQFSDKATLTAATKADVFLQLACGALSNARSQLIWCGARAEVKQVETALLKAERLRAKVDRRRARLLESFGEAAR